MLIAADIFPFSSPEDGALLLHFIFSAIISLFDTAGIDYADDASLRRRHEEFR